MSELQDIAKQLKIANQIDLIRLLGEFDDKSKKKLSNILTSLGDNLDVAIKFN